MVRDFCEWNQIICKRRFGQIKQWGSRLNTKLPHSCTTQLNEMSTSI